MSKAPIGRPYSFSDKRKKRLEADRERERLQQIKDFHAKQVERTRSKPPWHLPEGPEAA